ncbi:MAG: DUF438 domain-containing protein [Schwartzia sp. (in: firmicutes)]
MEKALDVTKTVTELVKEFPELRQAMAEIGFQEILNPVALEVVGRVMTLPKGAAVKGIPMETIREKLRARGFSFKDEATPRSETEAKGREEALKGLLARLSAGDPIDAVRADFVRDFASVSAEEIAAAEEALIKSGTPLREVQRLCDVHAALFHDHIAPAAAATGEGCAPSAPAPSAMAALPAGHPLRVLEAENEGLRRVLAEAETALCEKDTAALRASMHALNGLYPHYAKKETLLMTVLYRYDVTGPSGVMWGVDDEIKAELRALEKELARGGAGLKERVAAFLQRVREMIEKEEKILFPLTLRFFTETDWHMVYRDMPDMGFAFFAEAPAWPEGDAYIAAAEAEERAVMAAGKVHLPTGEMSVAELSALLALLPIDITFIDKDDTQRFFSNPGQVFARPRLALRSDVRHCHPASVLPMVEQLLSDFKAGRRDSMDVYRYIKGKPVGVRYLAVRDKGGAYLGTVELVQDFSDAVQAFGEKAPAEDAAPPHATP